jgi:hypothetical protein
MEVPLWRFNLIMRDVIIVNSSTFLGRHSSILPCYSNAPTQGIMSNQVLKETLDNETPQLSESKNTSYCNTRLSSAILNA